MADRQVIEIDRIRCDGFGMCAELLPELIGLDDWGYPIVGGPNVPEDLLGHARMAVEACPALAIRLRLEREARRPATRQNDESVGRRSFSLG